MNDHRRAMAIAAVVAITVATTAAAPGGSPKRKPRPVTGGSTFAADRAADLDKKIVRDVDTTRDRSTVLPQTMGVVVPHCDEKILRSHAGPSWNTKREDGKTIVVTPPDATVPAVTTPR